jgi:hypothetical protein
MSIWSHITATLDVDTWKSLDNLKEYVENQLKDAPVITGSEGNADIFVNVLSGYNRYTSNDCDRCQYKDTIIYLNDGGYQCEADADFTCPDGHYQTRVLISIVGDLRDKMKQKTKDEFQQFEKYVTKTLGYMLRNKSISIK